MTTTSDRRDLYPAMTPQEQEAVDDAWRAAATSLQNSGIKTVGDDRAENLVGAIARFVEDSKAR